MDFRHVRTFLVLAEELHFGRAAARLHIVQSAVSQTIKSLEQEVGARLFSRTKRVVTLTAAGHGFLHHARRAVEELESGSSEARRAASGEAGRLHLRFAMATALTPVSRVVARFAREHPRVQLRIDPGGTTEQFEAIRQGSCDIGFITLREDARPFASETVQKDLLTVLVASNHSLAGRRKVTFLDLAKEPHVMFTEESEPEIRARHRRRFATLGVPAPKVVLEVRQLDVLLALVASGVGIALMPGYFLRLGHMGVVGIPLDPKITVGISAVWDPTTLSPAGQRFLEILRQELRR